MKLGLQIAAAAVVVLGVAGTVFVACGSEGGGPLGPGSADGGGPGADGAVPDGGVGTGAEGRPDAGSGRDAWVPIDCPDAGGPPGTLDPTFGDGGMVWLKSPGGEVSPFRRPSLLRPSSWKGGQHQSRVNDVVTNCA